MEKQINRKVEQHFVEFKMNIKTFLEQNAAEVRPKRQRGAVKDEPDCDRDGQSLTSEFMQYVFDYPHVVFNKEDFQKRKRVKNVVEQNELCVARRANGEQCTRRRHDAQQFCGTHCKGQPHGIAVHDDAQTKPLIKIEVWVQDIKGINYYIDSNNNVYKPDDIVSNKPNPAVIAQWVLNEANVYSIPAFNI
jgi:hypothetical protein